MDPHTMGIAFLGGWGILLVLAVGKWALARERLRMMRKIEAAWDYYEANRAANEARCKAEVGRLMAQLGNRPAQ